MKKGKSLHINGLNCLFVFLQICLYIFIKLLKSLEEMKKNIISPFIQLIWDLISDQNLDNCICWSPNGTSFYITDSQAFSTDILSKHFKHANLSSFIRQLNMYNFHKNKNNTKQLEFFHKLFRRDAKQILIGIKRKPSEADHKEGEELLRQFLNKKYASSQTVKQSKQNEHFEEDKGKFLPKVVSKFLVELENVEHVHVIDSKFYSPQNFKYNFNQQTRLTLSMSLISINIVKQH